MTTLLVGFDSAWTLHNSGAVVAVLRCKDGTFHELGKPQLADFNTSQKKILSWQCENTPQMTIIMLDQPTIVENENGQREVENIVSSPIGLRYGGVQPANKNRMNMFGVNAPVRSFLAAFGGPADPLTEMIGTQVFETYPVLSIIALNWIITDKRATGRLPKYNPDRLRTFSLSDWQYMCNKAKTEYLNIGLGIIAAWLDDAAHNTKPRKSDQDCLDACICLLVAIYFSEGRDCIMVGNLDTGYMIVPFNAELLKELYNRCQNTGRIPSQWVNVIDQRPLKS